MTELYRPVGRAELDLIIESRMRAFPPRLPEQPIFYPVLTRGYAQQIAREWNTANGAVGYVTLFEIDASFLSGYDVQQVGGASHVELWVPAEELEEFNQHILGPIDVVDAYRGDPPAADDAALLEARTAAEVAKHGFAEPFRHPATGDMELAESVDTPPEVLTRLAGSEYPFVVTRLADNPSTPADTLAALVPARANTDHEVDLLLTLARNPSTHSDALVGVAELLAPRLDRSSLGREWWAIVSMFGRDDVSPAVLLGLLDSEVATRYFREEAAKRVVNSQVRDRLRRDKSSRVREAAEGERVQ